MPHRALQCTRTLFLPVLFLAGGLLGSRQVEARQEVPLFESPADIQKIVPRAHPGLNPFAGLRTSTSREGDLWPSLRDGALVTAQFLSSYYEPELYPEVYIFLRDALLVGYAWQLMEPRQERLRFLGLSRLVMDHPDLNTYLHEQGLGEAEVMNRLLKQQRILLYDSAFRMRLGLRVRQSLSPLAGSVLRYQLSQSSVDGVSETRLLGFREVLRNPEFNLLTFTLATAEFPKKTGRVVDYERDYQGRLRPLALRGNDRDEEVAVISEEALRRALEDLKSRAQDLGFRQQLAGVDEAVRQLSKIAKQVRREDLIAEMRTMIAQASHYGLADKQMRLLISDWIGAWNANPPPGFDEVRFSNAEVGIPEWSTLDLHRQELLMKPENCEALLK